LRAFRRSWATPAAWTVGDDLGGRDGALVTRRTMPIRAGENVARGPTATSSVCS
jgi:hypothetical protein